MDIQIRPELQRFIEDQMKAGRYDSATDMINAGLAALQTQQEFSSEEIDDLRTEVDQGLAEADRGEFIKFTADDVIARCRAEFEQKRTGS